MKINNSLRDACLNDIGAKLGAGRISVYSGNEPGVENNVTPENLLLTFDLASATGFAAASAGVMAMTGLPLLTNALLDGTATFFRLTAGSYSYQGTVTTSPTGEFVMNSTAIMAGATSQLLSFTITLPASS